ncbi:MAG: Ig-like domain-containing protein [Granulosicoccus sp.]
MTIPAVDVVALSGTVTITADANDNNGNAAVQISRVFAFDIDSPVPTIDAAPLATSANQASYQVSGDCTVGDGVVDVAVGNANPASQVAMCAADGHWAASFDVSAVSDGVDTLVISAVQTDASGNVGSAVTVLADKDTSEPSISIAVIAVDDIMNAAEVVTDMVIEGATADVADGQQVTVTIGGNTLTTSVAAGQWSLTVASNILVQLETTETITADVSTVSGIAAVQAVRDFIVDITPPPMPGVAILFTNQQTPVVQGVATIQPGDVLTVQVNAVMYVAGDGVLIDAGDGTWSLAIPVTAALSSGSYDVLVSLTDLAGNTSVEPGTAALTVDTSAIDAPLIALDMLAINDSGLHDDDDITNVTTPGFQVPAGSATPGSRVVLYSGADQIGVATVDADGSFVKTVSALADGTQWLSYRYDDDAGAVSGSSPAVSITIDTVAEEATIDSPIMGDDIINATESVAVDVSGVAEAGASLTVGFVDFSAQTVYTTVTVGVDGLWTLAGTSTNVSDLQAGGLFISLDVTDLAGNNVLDEYPGYADFYPTLQAPPVVAGLTTNDTTPTLTGSALLASGDELTVMVDGTAYSLLLGELSVDASGQWTLVIPETNALSEGTYDVQVAHVSQNTNTSVDTSSEELAIDLTPPSAPTVTALNTALWPAAITGTADLSDGGDLSVTLDGTTYTTADPELVDNGDDTWTLTLPNGAVLPDNTYDIQITLVDLAGNVSTDATNEDLVVDTVAPDVPTVAMLLTNQTAPVLQGTAVLASGESFAVLVNGNTYIPGDGALLGSGNDSWTLTIPTADAISDGSYDVLVTVSDAAGNTSEDVTSDELIIDTQLPPAPIIVALVSNSSTPVVFGTAAIDGGSLEVLLNGVRYDLQSGALLDNGDGGWTLTVPLDDALADGNYEVVASLTDAAGNQSTDTTTLELEIDSSAPQLAASISSPVWDNTPLFTGASDQPDNAIVEIRSNPAELLCEAAVLSGVWECESTVPLSNGVHNLVASTTDVNGGVANVSLAITIDQLADADADGIPDAVEGLEDSDGDGVPDYLDEDSDGDGIADSVEGSTDTDNDGTPDYLDTDADGDGIGDASEGIADSDGDGIPDYLDRVDSNIIPAGDLDGDGIDNATDPDIDGDGIDNDTEGEGDSDGDGTPDYLDLDSDNDGIADLFEGSDDFDGDGLANHVDPDADGDGIADSIEGRNDTDGDGAGNWIDTDSDGDGIDDVVETGVDTDSDGIADYLDLDSDGDTTPDSIEGVTDTDGNGIPDFQEFDESADSDNDGLSDLTEGSDDRDGDGIANYLDTDADGDGIDDSIEGGNDSDGDGIADYMDLDSDDDGIADEVEGQNDSDSDSLPDYIDTDSDADGIDDRLETAADNDGDGIINALDLDSDGDRISDAMETAVDSDGDGVYNALDLDSDNDGLPDEYEAASSIDALNAATATTRFDDAAGVVSSLLFGGDSPLASGNNSTGVFVLSPSDQDGDAVPDYLDIDSDNDSITDTLEADGRDLNSDGRIDGFTDNNHDGYNDASELDPLNAVDTDNDGLPDFRDADSDQDGLPDLIEVQGTDSDGDGHVDSFVDNNNDGISDELLIAPAVLIDSDNDSVPDFREVDSDNDGKYDLAEIGGEDVDGDGQVDSLRDSDGDGIADAVDVDQTGGSDADNDGIDDTADVDFATGNDADGDGIIDARDPDADGNGLADAMEPLLSAALPDSNGDQIPDYQQAHRSGAVETGINGNGIGCAIAPVNAGQKDPTLLLLLLGSLASLFARFIRRTSGLRRFARLVLIVLLGLALTSCAGLRGSRAESFQYTAPERNAASPVSSQSGSRFYAGVGIGASMLAPNTDNNDDLNVSNGSSSAGHLHLGRDISPRIGGEIHLGTLGEATFDSGGSIAYSEFGASALFYSASNRGRLAARKGPMGYLRAGLGVLNTTATDVDVEQLNSMHFLIGIGAEFGLQNGLGVRGELLSYDGDARALQLALIYRFGGHSSAANNSNRAAADDRRAVKREAKKQAKLARQAEADKRRLAKIAARAEADKRKLAETAARQASREMTKKPAARTVNKPTAAPEKRPVLGAAKAPTTTIAMRDTDFDGVMDANDACTGTRPGMPVDALGCAIFNGAVAGVEFEAGTDRMTVSSHRVLDRIARALLDDLSVNVQIAVYTDNALSPKLAVGLTRRQVIAVARYLISKQVSAKRLSARAYGSARPVASNGTAAGRAKNRRVEITIPADK